MLWCTRIFYNDNDMAAKPSEQLETFPNPSPERDFTIHISTHEFTCLCPKTGQPDFATLEFDYIPDELCIELKALKLYIWSYRDKGAFHEAITNKILEDVATAISPKFMRLTAKFNVRGGLYTTIVAEHIMEGWHPAEVITLP